MGDFERHVWLTRDEGDDDVFEWDSPPTWYGGASGPCAKRDQGEVDIYGAEWAEQRYGVPITCGECVELVVTVREVSRARGAVESSAAEGEQPTLWLTRDAKGRMKDEVDVWNAEPERDGYAWIGDSEPICYFSANQRDTARAGSLALCSAIYGVLPGPGECIPLVARYRALPARS